MTSLATDYECIATPNRQRAVLVGGFRNGCKALDFVGDHGGLLVAGGDMRVMLWNTEEEEDDDDDDDDDDGGGGGGGD